MNPQKLQKLFILISFIGACVILGFSYLGMSTALKNYNIESAKRISKSVGYVLFKLEQNTLIDQTTNQLRQELSGKMLNDFDERVRKLLKPLGVHKIKIFSLENKIIYSTDHQLIGEIDGNNHFLLSAIKGVVTSGIETKNDIVDLAYETRFDVDVVETYLPMYDLHGDVKGVYEVYMDMTPYQISSEKALTAQITSLAGISLVIFLLLNLLIWVSTKKLASLQGSLEYQATHDVLTKIHNRSYINERLKEELAHTKRSSTKKDPYQVAIIIIDIDNFKNFNDRYGHLLGDEILMAFSERLKTTLREGDVVGRYGGEEFIVIFPMTDSKEALKLTNRIHYDLTSVPFVLNGESYEIKASIGITNILVTDNFISDVFIRADKALYYVKANGRNNITEFKPDLD